MRGRRIGLAVEFHLLYKRHIDIFTGAIRYARQHHWTTVNDDWIEGTLAKASPDDLPFDGIIARVDAPRVGLAEEAKRLGIPVVNVLTSSPLYDALPGVFPDYEMIGRMRAEHLLSRGLYHFACPAIRGRASDQREADAFTGTIEAAGFTVARLELPPRWGDTLQAYRHNNHRIERWMDSWLLPMGVASCEDVMARHIATRCLERGWRIPDDVAIIGGHNEEQVCDQLSPSLSSVEVGFEKVGYEAARLLHDLMKEVARARKRGKTPLKRRRATPAKPKHVIMPPVGVVVRTSTNFETFVDPLVMRAQTYMANNCEKPLTLETVAATLPEKPAVLERRFRQSLKRTFVKELRRLRLEKAKRTLVTTGLALGDVAKVCGFPSGDALGDMFRLEVGVSPQQFRIQRQGRSAAE
jgi:LacI family transcriptional regulator